MTSLEENPSHQVKVITQKTFDLVVRENIDDFEMDPDEALEDAIDQFEKQKISLKMIIKSVPTSNEDHEVLSLTKKLETLLLGDVKSDSKDDNFEEIQTLMKGLKIEFDRDISYRYQASKTANAGQIVYKACMMSKHNPDLFTVCLETFVSLLKGQPDLITSDGIKCVLQLVQDCANSTHALLYLRIIKLACTAHEHNRQTVVENNGIEVVLKCSEHFNGSCDIVKEACSALRSLTLDDDVRVQFGKAHEYTKEIVKTHRGLERIFAFVKEHENNAALASEVCLTLGKLMVRNEFCQQMVDMGGLELIIRLMRNHMDRPVLIRQCLGLMKAIGGNDDVKRAICKSEALDLIIESLRQHGDVPNICEAVFAAITTVSLRNPSHCDMIISKGFAPLVTTAMQQHEKHAGLQKQACMAIRNLVVRTRHNRTPFIELNVESLIQVARSLHGKILEDESKAALRDLDLDVELQCRWLNKNPGVTTN